MLLQAGNCSPPLEDHDMELTPLICPRCGAKLEAKDGENEYRCQYCGVTLVRDAGGAAARLSEEKTQQPELHESKESRQQAEQHGKEESRQQAERHDSKNEVENAGFGECAAENEDKTADGTGGLYEGDLSGDDYPENAAIHVPVPKVTLGSYILQCVKWALLPAFALSLLMSVLAGAEYIFAGTLIFLPGFLLIAVLVFFFRNLKSYKERRHAYEEYKKRRHA